MTRIITITGDLSCGKSTVAEKLCEKLGFKRVSAGKLQRWMAETHGVTTLDLNYLAAQNPRVDDIIDSLFPKLHESRDDLVVDARTAWHFLPQSFKVQLRVNPKLAAERAFNDPRRQSSEPYDSIEAARESLHQRRLSECSRFQEKYGIDIDDDTNFDVVIDTSLVSPEDISVQIQTLAEAAWKGHPIHCHWLSPKQLIPLQSIRETFRDYKDIDEDWISWYSIRETMGNTGFDTSEPVYVLKFQEHYFIYDGHRRTSAAIEAGLPFIPVVIFDENSLLNCGKISVADYVRGEWRSQQGPRQVHDWEAALKFHISGCPDFSTRASTISQSCQGR